MYISAVVGKIIEWLDNMYGVTTKIKKIHKYLEFKLTEEENNINYLDVPTHRNNHNL